MLSAWNGIVLAGPQYVMEKWLMETDYKQTVGRVT